MLFVVAIVLAAVAWRLGLTAIAAFWWAYVLPRPLGASAADCVSKPRSASGIGLGDGLTALIAALAVAICVACLAITRRDSQPPGGQIPAGREPAARTETSSNAA